jgi:hypothetical protein
VLILPMQLGAFRPPKPDNRIWRYALDFPRAFLMLHDTDIQVAGDANVKRARMAAENVDVGAGHSKMLASSWSRPQGKTVGSAPVIEKLRAAWAK